MRLGQRCRYHVHGQAPLAGGLDEEVFGGEDELTAVALQFEQDLFCLTVYDHDIHICLQPDQEISAGRDHHIPVVPLANDVQRLRLS